MKEKVLKTMVEAVDNVMSFSKSDFYRYDLKTLANADEKEPFFWSVREGATTLLLLNAEQEREKLVKSEKYRFVFMNSPRCYIDHFIEVSKWGGKIFFYDGEELMQVDPNEAEACIIEYFVPVVKDLKKYVTKFFAKKDGGDYTRKVDVHFCNQETLQQFLNIARTDEGKELLKTVRSFRHLQRKAADHKAYISRDFNNKSFQFIVIATYNNGETSQYNGGIIYNGGHWTIHT